MSARRRTRRPIRLNKKVAEQLAVFSLRSRAEAADTRRDIRINVLIWCLKLIGFTSCAEALLGARTPGISGRSEQPPCGNNWARAAQRIRSSHSSRIAREQLKSETANTHWRAAAPRPSAAAAMQACILSCSGETAHESVQSAERHEEPKEFVLLINYFCSQH